MMSLTFGLFTQVSGSGPLGPLVFFLLLMFPECTQCWKLPVAQWPNAPYFCLGPPEISKFWTVVAQIIFLAIVNEWDLQLVAILGL